VANLEDYDEEEKFLEPHEAPEGAAAVENPVREFDVSIVPSETIIDRKGSAIEGKG
jgi:hypothetical protein